MSKSMSIAAAFAALLASGTTQAAPSPALPPADAATAPGEAASQVIDGLAIEVHRHRSAAEVELMARPSFRLFDNGPSFVKYIRPKLA